MNNDITVIYDRQTGRVIMTEQNGVYTLPVALDMQKFHKDAQVFTDDGKGNVYLKASAMPGNGKVS